MGVTAIDYRNSIYGFDYSHVAAVNLETGKTTRLAEEFENIEHLSVSHDGKTLCVSSGGNLTCLRVSDDGKVLRKIKTDIKLTTWVGYTIIDALDNAVICDWGKNRLLYVDTLFGNWRVLAETERRVRTVAITGDGVLIVSYSSERTKYDLIYGSGVAPPVLRRSVRQALRLARLLLLQRKVDDRRWCVMRSVLHVVHGKRGVLPLDAILDVACDRSTLGDRSRVALATAVAAANA
jgi:hypothetical protein